MASPAKQTPTAHNDTTPRPQRVTLASVSKGRLDEPMRLMVKGVQGVGKTTFAAGAPGAIFLPTEDGTAQLDVARFPKAKEWLDVVDAVRSLSRESHGFKTLVLDTVDWAEPLLWDFICKRDQKKNMEAYGYNKGFDVALDEWRVFLGELEAMQRATKMHVIFLAHIQIRNFKNPEGEDYDRYELALNKKASGFLSQWCDADLFANHETVAYKGEKAKRARGVSTGSRLLYTAHSAAYDAKNRYSLPDTLPLDWAEFEAAVKAQEPADPDALIAAIHDKAKRVGGKQEKHAVGALKEIGKDAARLAKLNDWLNFELNKKEEASNGN